MSKIYQTKNAAAKYDTARALPEHATSLLIDVLKENTPVDSISTVLDLGGGTGRFSSLLQNLYKCPVYTLDPSLEMLKQGVSRNLNDVHWVTSAAEYIPLKNDSINLVFMSNIYHHLENHSLVIHEISRVLIDRGNLVIRNGTQETDSEIIWNQFFPEAIKFDEDRIPHKQDIIDAVSSHSLKFVEYKVIYQKFASSYQEYYEKISQRGLSSLLAISDDAFNNGCKKFREWVETQPPDTPVFEPIDHFFFIKE
ncbi:MAG: class I SAM-dependent methyltransferase [Dehalococcoidales bacterium]|nr:MAG: class I SAM-dependent methyltransferase [Dehalococcoidales bacterium]